MSDLGVGATRNLVQGNYIGVAPGGGYLFGTGNPGNTRATGSGSRTASSTRSVAPRSRQRDHLEPRGRRLITARPRLGIPATGTGNTVANNIIGLTADGGQVLGNDQDGVAIYSPAT